MTYIIGKIERLLYPEILYRGCDGHTVTKQVYPDDGVLRLKLEPSLKLRNHSPTGFSWGYNGSGPSQLALALLLDATTVPDTALQYYQEFKWDIVAGWPPHSSWSISRSEIIAWVSRKYVESIRVDKN